MKIPFLVGWTSIWTQLFWCELHGVQGFDTLPNKEKKLLTGMCPYWYRNSHKDTEKSAKMMAEFDFPVFSGVVVFHEHGDGIQLHQYGKWKRSPTKIEIGHQNGNSQTLVFSDLFNSGRDKKKLNPVKPSRFHGHFRRTYLSLRQEKNMLSMMPSNEVYCSHSKRLAPTHLVTNLIDFQATTSFEVLQAMQRVISLTYPLVN